MFEEVIKFIRSLYDTEQAIPLHTPSFTGNEKKYVMDCIDTHVVSSVGGYVSAFEQATADFCGCRYAVASVNGTEALHMALMLCNVSAEDEVITQPLTFVATVNAISYTGAVPVFVDVDKDTMGLSPEKLKDFLTHNTIQKKSGTYNRYTGRRIRACVPMHTFGHPCRIEDITEICSSYNITVIEDAAESLGSFYKGKHTGTFGKIGTLSFNGNKIVTTGGGGMLITDDEALAKLGKHLTTQAKVPHPWEYVHDYIGYNHRMPNINAALGLAQIENLPLFVARKRELAKRYENFFSKIGIPFFKEPENCISNYWLNAIILKDETERDNFLKETNDNNIFTRPIWKLIPSLKMYKHCHKANIDNAKWLAERVVNLPSSVHYHG
ncbi:MAG: LegC family aminotransferase [Cytophagaceae bacterium]|nr:LegC family aminotransferase [Cytophagaceae bacterium]MDW8455881.1 LegC family aminotransferase [Cytophagaceae bacterium]